MTTKTLTSSNYPGGYFLNTNYSGLVIDPGVSVGSSSSLVGVYATDAAKIVNYGTVAAGPNEIGVFLKAGGTLINGSASDKTALITSGVETEGASSTLSNFGTIQSADPGGGFCVYLGAGGSVTNGSATDTTAVISDSTDDCVVSAAATTVTNFGTISSSTGAPVYFESSAGRLIVEKSAVFVGKLKGGGGTLELAGGSDTITGLDGAGVMTGSTSASFSGFGTYIVDAGVDLTLTGTNDLTLGQSLDVSGSLLNTGTLTTVATSGDGVTLAGAGRLTNGSATDTSALIAGYDTGVDATGASAAISNFGTISGNAGQGVYLAAAGTVTNGSASDTKALIGSRLDGVDARGAVTVTNFGTIDSTTSSNGVYLYVGGSVTNGSASDTTALIEGATGVFANTAAGKVVNFGTITGATYGGVFLYDGGSVTNGSATDHAALIEGAAGVTFKNTAATVTNFGTLSGSAGTAVKFGSATDRLIVESGATFVGALVGGGGTLELAGGSDTITGLGGAGKMTGATSASFSGFGTYDVDTGAELTLTGANALTTGQSLSVAGALVNTGAISGAGTLALNGGTATFDAGTNLTIAKVTQSGAATEAIFALPALTYAKVWDQTSGAVSVASGDRVNFTGKGDTFDGTLTGAGTVALFGGSDTLTGTTLSAKSVIIQNGPTVTLAGTIDLTTTLTATTNNLIIGAGGATLSGGGVLSLTNTATNTVVGADIGATLTNDDTIKGAGRLGAGTMTLVNSAGALIDAVGTLALTINTGNNAITNAGTIQAGGPGGLTIASPLDNTGVLIANPGTLAVNRAVTGAGIVRINGGTADFASAFNEKVDFTGPTGVLELSQAYSGAVTGLSKTGSNAIVLLDVAFKGVTTAAYSGSATSGVLTVTEGSSVAKINLVGDYLGSTFTLSAGPGDVGTQIVDPTAAPIAATHRFIAAAAGFAAPQATTMAVDPDGWRAPPPMLGVSKALT